MVKVLLFVLAALAMLFTETTAQCVTFYTRGKAGTYGTKTFTGITNGTDIQNYNNPMWYSLASAKSGTGAPNGRFIGFLSQATQDGNFAFEFFKTNSFITIQWGKGTNGAPNVVTGGTGCYVGRTGTAIRTTVQTTPVPVFTWNLCPQTKKTCTGQALRKQI